MFPLRDTNRSRHFPFVNWLLIILNALVFFFQLSLGPTGVNRFINSFALVPARLSVQPTWFAITILTSMFMHSGWLHFIANMWTLYIFGDNVEDRMGPIGYLLFYMGGGVAAAMLQSFTDINSVIPMLGASGAIAAVLGAYMLMYPRARVLTLVPLFFIFTTVEIPAIFYLAFWFITQLSSGFSTLASAVGGGVAWWAHIGGFVFGLFMYRLFLWRPLPSYSPPYIPPYHYRE